MLTITVEFLHGTYHADPSGLAHTGQLRQGEWPPAPLRLLAAFVAADGTGRSSRHTDGSELAYLEECDPPRIYASEPDRVWHQRLQPRYVAKAKDRFASAKEKGQIVHHAEYIGREGAQVRPGVRVAPASSRVDYVWDVEPPASVIDGLRIRAARVGYLGCADSPVRVTVSQELPESRATPYEPDAAGDTDVGVPRPGVIAALDAHFERWMAGGPSVHRSQSPGLRRFARYRSPSGSDPEISEQHAPMIWLVLDSAISGRRVSAVTETFKAATLDLYQRHVGDPPALLHGHGFGTSEHALARFLALPDVGGHASRGRIHGLALWLPPVVEPAVVESCRLALRGLTNLGGAGFSVGCHLWAGERRPWAANPARWERRATRWATAFPAVHERRVRTLALSDVTAWCDHAGLPAPVAFRSSRAPFLHGGVDLLPVEVNRPGRDPKPYSHLELLFADEVHGPVVIGAGRQRGFGLCAPVERREANRE